MFHILKFKYYSVFLLIVTYLFSVMAFSYCKFECRDEEHHSVYNTAACCNYGMYGGNTWVVGTQNCAGNPVFDSSCNQSSKIAGFEDNITPSGYCETTYSGSHIVFLHSPKDCKADTD